MSLAYRPLARRVASVGVMMLTLGAGGESPPAVNRSISNPIGEAFAVVFDSEWIWLDIVGDSLEVRGIFLYRCRTPIDEPVALFFPFPKDSLLGGARMVSLSYRADTDPPKPATWEEFPGAWGVRWWLPPCTGDSIVAETVYRQKITTGYARYILTSARIWGRPLQYASFEIRLPPGAEPIEFSLPFEPRRAGSETTYVCEVRNYVPDRDIVVRWRE